jgi:hypothetical protein
MPNSHTPVNEYSANQNSRQASLRHDWQVDDIADLFALAFQRLNV